MILPIYIFSLSISSISGDTTIGRTKYNHIQYFQSQKLKELGHLKKGNPNGYWIEFFENGKNKKVSNYKNGILCGDYFEWHSNGQIKEEGKYKNGNKIGKWVIRDENGKIIKVEIYKNGQIKKSTKYQKENINENLLLVTLYSKGDKTLN